MRRRFKQIMATLLCLGGCVPAPRYPIPVERWAAYYDTKRPADDFSHLDVVVFDSRYHPDFKLLNNHTEVLAYISLGEVHGDVPEKTLLERKKALLYHNDKWDSYAVDLSSPVWQRSIMTSVNKAITKGFNGVMLDTVDSPLEWARKESPERYEAMQKSAVSLIAAIRKKYPNIRIMLNRGFVILPDAETYLDYVLAESILTYKDEFTGQYRMLPPQAYADAVAQLHAVVSRTAHIKIMTLDYWDVDDGKGLDKIYEKQRQAGFIPYVTSPDLRHFTPEKTQFAQHPPLANG